MNSWYQQLVRNPTQAGLTVFGASAIALILLRSLLKKRQKLTGKVVVITGASSGIGEALAHKFVDAGCRVILAARSIDKLKEIKQELLDAHEVTEDDITAFYLDLEDSGSISSAVKSMVEIYGRIDILINNAGVGCSSSVADMKLSVCRKVMEVNFFGQVEITKEILPHMIKQGGGSIIAISSLQGRFALPKKSAYGASKHALQAFCDSLRAENAGKNVHVLVVSPSYVKTNIARAGLTGSGTVPGVSNSSIEKGMTAEACAQQVLKAIQTFQTDLLVGPLHHRLVVYIRALCPSLYNYIMSRL